MELSNAYRQHQLIAHLQAEIAAVEQEITVTEWAYKLAFVATFVVYLIFVWMMYVSDLWGFTSWLIDNLSEVAALLVYSVLAITLPLSMALIKEIGYKHFAKYRNPTVIIVLIVGILALAGVVYESISSSSQQQHISTSAAEKSKTFQVISQSNTAPVETGSMASLIARAQQQLARCEQKLKAGKEKHCEGDKAKLHSYLAAEQRAMDSAERASVAAIEAKTRAMQTLKEDAYKPAFKAIRDSFGVSISTGVMLVTLFISIIFEISHLLLILFLSQKLKRLEGLKQDLIRQEADYLQSTGKTFKAEDFTDESVLNRDDIREHSPAPMGFGQPARAQFKYQQKPRQPMGFIQTDHLPRTMPPASATPATPKPTTGIPNPKLGTAETQLEMAGLTPPEISTYNRELAGQGIPSPADQTLNRTANKADIQRIIERGLGTSKPDQQTVSQPSAEGLSDKPDETLSQPSAEGLAEPSAEGRSGLYPEWIKAVQQKQCKPSVRATWLWIQKRISNKETGSRTHDRTRITIMQKAFFSRAINDGLMKPNPNYRNGGKKYLWIG